MQADIFVVLVLFEVSHKNGQPLFDIIFLCFSDYLVAAEISRFDISLVNLGERFKSNLRLTTYEFSRLLIRDITLDATEALFAASLACIWILYLNIQIKLLQVLMRHIKK